MSSSNWRLPCAARWAIWRCASIISARRRCRDWPPKTRSINRLGYIRRTDITADHRPALADGPDSDWHKWYYRAPAAQRPTHLHVRMQGRPNQRYALLFRDYLRAHPAAAAAYGTIKQLLVRLHPTDVEAYYNVKDPVCDIIWAAADAWAQTSGWDAQQT
jgi:GrpB-like predicted nucleotidyltransferase (UPF0157 family)